MTNEKFATDALEAVKKIANPIQGFRSSNKLYPGEAVKEADVRRDKYTHSARVLGAEGLLPEEAAKQLVEMGIANCTDLAWVASEEIRKVTAEWSLVRAGIDHVFVAVGVDFDEKSVPKDPATWKPDSPELGAVWICDPWANLCVAASDYTDAWDARMEEWEEQGLRIGVPGRKWVSPTEWLGLIDNSEKKELTSRGESAPSDSDDEEPAVLEPTTLDARVLNASTYWAKLATK